jgi:hypothetical protein
MLRIGFIFAVLIGTMGVFLQAKAADAPVSKIEKDIAEMKSKYPVWGALSYAIRRNRSVKDAIVVNIMLNEIGQEIAQKLSRDHCVSKKIGVCVTITFPGCYFFTIGKKPREPDKTYMFSTRAEWGPGHLTKLCHDSGAECLPPAGGCNYLTKDGNNRLVTGERLKSLDTEWIIAH